MVEKNWYLCFGLKVLVVKYMKYYNMYEIV